MESNNIKIDGNKTFLNVKEIIVYLAHQSVFLKNTNMKEVLNRIEKIYTQTPKDIKSRLYIHLYNILKNAIINKDVPNGFFLPASRKLALILDISRSTVNKSYDLLVLEGYVESKPGAGYLILDLLEKTKPEIKSSKLYNYPKLSDAGISFLKNTSLINTTDDKNIAFRPGLPPLDIFPIKQWQNLSNFYWRHATYSDLSYYPASGIEPLKKNLANYLNISRNIKCNYQQIVIVAGSLQSIYLIAKATMNLGDSILLENPTFPNVTTLFKSFRSNIIPLELDQEGAIIKSENLENIQNPKLIHLTPAGHYPSGTKMSKSRKLEILDWASQNHSLIIENDYEHEINSNKNDSPTLFSLDKQDRTIYLGTFNRLLHPSIRLGFMIVPFHLLETVQALQKLSHRFISPSYQYVMNQFIEKKHLLNHIKKLQQVVHERKEIMLESFNQVFDKRLRITDSKTNGLHVLVEFPEEMNEQKCVNLLVNNNLVVHPYSKCFSVGKSKGGMILGYASVPNHSLRKKIIKMGQLFEKHLLLPGKL